MKTIDHPPVLTDLTSRLQRLSPTSSAQWGKMTCQQMLVHLADAMEAVTRGQEFAGDMGSPSKFIKFIALRTPLSWPKGLPTVGDPASLEVDESAFDRELQRTISALAAMARADGAGFTSVHPAFGPMSKLDWYRWAQRHLDHHLRQFGV